MHTGTWSRLIAFLALHAVLVTQGALAEVRQLNIAEQFGLTSCP